jgi:SSS family solute:Na+ symporter
MTLTTIDWIVVAIPFLIVIGFAIATRRYVRSVADFLSGGRIAGRYLVAVSDGMAAMGLITVVAFFEMFYKSGFTVNFWSQLQTPATLLLGLTGFVFYRFRETRAMTLAQFFEQRYSRGFRQLTGWLAAISGVVNYGIFPAVGMRFVMHYANLPATITLGGISLSTYAVGMAFFLATALMVVLFGGQMAIMVSDCVQSMFSLITFLVVTGVILLSFSWEQMSAALDSQPAGQSMLNPFDGHKIEDFNVGFALISLFITIYITMAWQGNQGYNCAAVNPHEAKMGKLLGGWRGGITYAMVLLMTIGAYTYLHHDAFAQDSATARASIAAVEDATVRSQVEVPVALAHLLPVGVSGMFLAMMLFLMLSTDTTYLHSWGSIIVQDVILPLRRKPFKPAAQLTALRLSITGVAVFAFLFSLLYKQNDFILMFFALTGALYLGGAGACIIGGLYWSRGTASGAWSAMLTGTILGVAGIILQQAWPSLVPQLLKWFPDNAYLLANLEKFPINGQWLAFFTMLTAMVVYVVVSWLTCRSRTTWIAFYIAESMPCQRINPRPKIRSGIAG